MRRFDLLRVNAITAGYRKGVDVLHEVGLDVHEHETVSILGSNGAGKSTLLSAIAGLLTPTSGTVEFVGENITGLPAHLLCERGIVLVGSGRMIFPDQTVEDNLAVGAHIHRKERARSARLMQSVFEQFEVLAVNRRELAGRLSGGQQQILVIARGLMAGPKLLMLDEPCMGLDPAGIDAVFETIGRLREEGVAMLIVEKIARLAESTSDRLAVMELGRMVLFGETAAVASDERVEEAYLGRVKGRVEGVKPRLS